MSETMMCEIWKPVVGNENRFSVSSLGRVRAEKKQFGKRIIESRILKTHLGKNSGYVQVGIEIDGKRTPRSVHRLMARAFLGISDLVVNHINADKTDNRIENLEYVSIRENTLHSPKSNKLSGIHKRKNKKSERWSATISINRERHHLGIFDTELEASEAYQKAVNLAGGSKYGNFPSITLTNYESENSHD